ncbi:MAG: dihydroxy-acid dehydratase, partial [Paramuribaculum sp.]
ANSMNSLTEALGLSLPGNGTIVATHINRRKLMTDAARRIVRLADTYYKKGDTSVLPRSIASRHAMLNAMTLDIAMGGSTNTVLHLLAVAHEAGTDFRLDDIDALSRRVPVLCKVAPNSAYHIEDVNRAGGIISILAELDRAGLVDTTALRADGLTLRQAIDRYAIGGKDYTDSADELWRSAPGLKRSTELGRQMAYYSSLDTDRTSGCIRDIAHAYTTDGGLAVLHGNIAADGCVVKTAGVDTSILRFRGTARVCQSQEQAVEAILSGRIKAGDVVVITYEGPRGGPGMQEMLYPTSYLKSRHLGRECALITDGRFSGGTSGLSIGHISPEAAAGGNIALVRDGDTIAIDIPARTISLEVSDEELAERRRQELARGDKAFTPTDRDRHVSRALRAYAAAVSSADKGAVRIIG